MATVSQQVSMLLAGQRRPQEMAVSFSMPVLVASEIDGGTISLVGRVKATMQGMSEALGELVEEFTFLPEALPDKSQVAVLMSKCYELFDLGCVQGAALVMGLGGELPATMVADGHFLLQQSWSASPLESGLQLPTVSATTASAIEDTSPACKVDSSDESGALSTSKDNNIIDFIMINNCAAAVTPIKDDINMNSGSVFNNTTISKDVFNNNTISNDNTLVNGHVINNAPAAVCFRDDDANNDSSGNSNNTNVGEDYTLANNDVSSIIFGYGGS
ncbi:hypothetical protein CBR_g40889 [Chara braunii]|uniref:Uncharacterized protein n=1 Tax=Chara braunii TaxID=69332 RepID=A0A388K2D8_CHABU|nr:hypothetical protein CBR_g40889 [Chara braunii]|eukprot:GBG64189.1 hypothetical protein CBR_g40889 [Chara braunii]